MKEMNTGSQVPAFLSKLWALVEEPTNRDIIAWNWNGQNFCIRDEQRFCKEILPRYFKHNNLSSFIRQLNMYGFRKVMSLESGLIKPENSSAIEFQHPYFKKGKAELLENIKRKVSAVKVEDDSLAHEDLHKVLAELQELKDVQSSMDTKLDNMRRENQALWAEVTALRRKHSQQQKLLAKILQFILSLMRGNLVMGSKRKRPLTIEASESSASKYSRSYIHKMEGQEHPEISSDTFLMIHGVPGSAESTSERCQQITREVHNYTTQQGTPANTDDFQDTGQALSVDEPVFEIQSQVPDLTMVPSNAAGGEGLALDLVQPNSEDPDDVINSILHENCSTSSNIPLDREEIQDFLSCIDASLEELQTMLFKKKLDVSPDIIEELFNPDLSSSDTSVTGTNASLNNDPKKASSEVLMPITEDLLNRDKQLMLCHGNPLLSLFNDVPSNDYGVAPPDPSNVLASVEEDVLPSGSSEHCYAAPSQDTSKEIDLQAEEFSGSLPIYVLSPVRKLLDEVTELETV
ncbi:heat shock factor protein 3-like [Discoglossus pictus]